MANVTKYVSRAVPPTMRYQTFDNTEVVSGDVVMVEQSLGHPAGHVEITTSGYLNIKLNVYHTVFTSRPSYPGFDSIMGAEGMPNLTSGFTVTDDSMDPITLEPNATWTLDNMPIRDIQITSGGIFRIFVK